MNTIMGILLQALVMALPVVVGGLLHVAVIKLRWFPSLADIPLDGGLTWRGRRLFGANKTVRGAVVMVAATAIAAWVCTWLSAGAPALPVQHEQPLWWGALLGAGYILGELPNSAAKRQLDIEPGAAAPTTTHPGLRPLFWLVDQVDFLAGIVVVVAVAGHPLPWPIIGALVGVALVVHPLVAALMVGMGLKSRVG